MSTLAEIEAAVEALPHCDQERLLSRLAARIQPAARDLRLEDDPVIALIGAFDGPKDSSSRRADEILYGAGE